MRNCIFGLAILTAIGSVTLADEILHPTSGSFASGENLFNVSVSAYSVPSGYMVQEFQVTERLELIASGTEFHDNDDPGIDTMTTTLIGSNVDGLFAFTSDTPAFGNDSFVSSWPAFFAGSRIFAVYSGENEESSTIESTDSEFDTLLNGGTIQVGGDFGSPWLTFSGIPNINPSFGINMPRLEYELDVTATLVCAGDANGDNSTDFIDLELVLANWESTVTPWTDGDVNGDGFVDFADMNIVLDNWNQTCS